MVDQILDFCGHPLVLKFLLAFKRLIGKMELHYTYFTKLLMMAFTATDCAMATKIIQVCSTLDLFASELRIQLGCFYCSQGLVL